MRLTSNVARISDAGFLRRCNLLHRPIPVPILIEFQFRSDAIVLNVRSQIMKLLFRANEVVKRFTLPKMSFAIQSSIDFRSSEL